MPIIKSCFYFGTFNPVHSGHLMVAQQALAQFGKVLDFDRVTFVPAFLPPHRQSENNMADFAHRLAMLQLACQSNPNFQVSELEAHLPTPSYTANTLRHIRSQTEKQIRSFPFIIGADALQGLLNWHQPECIIEQVHFLQAPRPDFEPVSTVSIAGGQTVLVQSHIEMPTLGISSSWIRQQIAREAATDSVQYFIPETVRRYIDWNGLYR